MKRSRDLMGFTEALLTLGSRPAPELLAVFAAGLLAVSLFSNWAYDVLTSGLVFRSAGTAWSLGATGLLLAVAFLLWQHYLAGLRVATLVEEQSTMEAYPGLVWVLSPGSIEAPMLAIQHHLPRLERLWVIITAGDEAVAATLEALHGEIAKAGWSFTTEIVEVPAPDMQATHAAVERIYRERVPGARLSPAETAADITGGLKPMSAGMALACALNGWPMEYLASDRTPSGEVRPGSQRLVQVEVGFKPARRGDQEG